jgi:hypothetical protein
MKRISRTPQAFMLGNRQKGAQDINIHVFSIFVQAE